MRVRHSKSYQLLAVEAAKRASLKGADAEKAAADPAARELRDGLWLEYESRLRDSRTFELKEIRDWLDEHNSAVAISSVHRDRKAVLDSERAITLRAKMARAVVDAASESGESDVLKASRIMAGQTIFNALAELPADALDDMTAAQVLRLIDTVGSLSTADAQADLMRAKLAELERKFDEQVAAKKALRPSGELTAKDIAEIRKAVFGEAA